ncbi:hypothetical protein PI23P_03532 [Polaribacter irgensii 23-P]|uniref:Uncharacterized protein n=1 Tax=Polaribacter irgensii 23-P TaxID=313594 RepID=A4BX43_9FLAO|nr:hypothetical protein PI23P_03532 [Polaribacter irgensii 23-P]
MIILHFLEVKNNKTFLIGTSFVFLNLQDVQQFNLKKRRGIEVIGENDVKKYTAFYKR